MSPLPPKVSRILFAAIVAECVVLGAIQVRRWMGKDSRSPGDHAASVSVAGTPPHAAASPSSRAPSAPATSPETASARRGAVQGPSEAGDVRSVASDSAAVLPPDAPHAAAPPVTVPTAPASGQTAGADPGDRFDPGRPQAHVAPPGLNAAQPGDSSASSRDGISKPSSGPSGSAANGSVTSSVATPGMPAVVPNTDSSGDRPYEDGDSKDSDKSDDEDSGRDDAGDDDSTADSTPPVVEALHFDPAQVEGGAATTLIVQASDAKSGLRSIWGEVRSPNRAALVSFGSGSLGPGPVFTFPISLPPGAQNGTWYVAWISLTDGAANSKVIQAGTASAAPPGGTFTVSSSDSDATPPEILQVWFDRSVVGPGEKNTIVVEARDDLSGIASLMGACQSPSKSALVWFTGAVNADSGRWVGEVAIPRNADCGEWVVQQLAVKDKAGNTTLIQTNSPLLARAGFQVSSGSDCDFTSPTLEAFDLTPAVVVSGTATEIVVSARVEDVGSGALTMTGYFEGPVPPGGQAPKNYFTCSPDPRDPAAPWTGRIQVPQTAARGTWKVGNIRLEDKAKNARTYTSADPVVSGRVFQVQ